MIKMYDSYAYPIIEKENFNKAHDRYLIVTGQKQYDLPPPTPQNDYASKSGSIESIFEQDAHALLDKVVTTAFSIVYRIQIYNDAQKTIDYSRLKMSSQLSQLYEWLPGTNMNIERRKSMIIKEMNQLDRQKLEHKLSCWKDMSEPVNNLVSLFHQGKEQKQDRQFLE